MAENSQHLPLVIVILDGWGISLNKKGNAILAAKTPTINTLEQFYPTIALTAAGVEVGLPWGEVGNSETGHSNIGAGQVQYQALPRINKAIEDKTFFENQSFLHAIQHTKQHNSNLHIMGLVSPGGIHSHLDHLIALLNLANQQEVTNVYLHLFTDGQDSPPQSALTYLQKIEEAIGKYHLGKIASVTGRLYAMDRNDNWDRTKKTYDALTGGPRASGAPSPRAAIDAAYQNGLRDYNIPPTVITRGGSPIASITDNDTVIFFNYRPDRARQLTKAFVQKEFNEFERHKSPKNLFFCTMTSYAPGLSVAIAFVQEPLQFPLARILSDASLKQLHIAETEKYAHITYYLNGGHEDPFPGEDRILIKSSAVKNFAATPAMATEQITDRCLDELKKNKYHVYFINFANADMVGHTGNFEASVKACEQADLNLSRVYQSVLKLDATMIVTADHGNAEEMINSKTGEAETDHTGNPVPLYFVQKNLARTTPRSAAEITRLYSEPVGVLSDIAPTVLEILNLSKPPSMASMSLLSSLK